MKTLLKQIPWEKFAVVYFLIASIFFMATPFILPYGSRPLDYMDGVAGGLAFGTGFLLFLSLLFDYFSHKFQ